jgi:hypothetical protein
MYRNPLSKLYNYVTGSEHARRRRGRVGAVWIRGSVY